MNYISIFLDLFLFIGLLYTIYLLVSFVKYMIKKSDIDNNN